jgi:hypothetical protein
MELEITWVKPSLWEERLRGNDSCISHLAFTIAHFSLSQCHIKVGCVQPQGRINKGFFKILLAQSRHLEVPLFKGGFRGIFRCFEIPPIPFTQRGA